jgi:hypothetical protein
MYIRSIHRLRMKLSIGPAKAEVRGAGSPAAKALKASIGDEARRLELAEYLRRREKSWSQRPIVKQD